MCNGLVSILRSHLINPHGATWQSAVYHRFGDYSYYGFGFRMASHAICACPLNSNQPQANTHVKPVSTLSSDDLPEPDGPMMAVSSPARKQPDRWSNITFMLAGREPAGSQRETNR